MTQKEKQDQKEQMELAMNAIGVMAEMSLAFFRLRVGIWSDCHAGLQRDRGRGYDYIVVKEG